MLRRIVDRLIFTDRAVITDAYGSKFEVEGKFFTWFGRHLIEFYVIGGAATVGIFILLQ